MKGAGSPEYRPTGKEPSNTAGCAPKGSKTKIKKCHQVLPGKDESLNGPTGGRGSQVQGPPSVPILPGAARPSHLPPTPQQSNPQNKVRRAWVSLTTHTESKEHRPRRVPDLSAHRTRLSPPTEPRLGGFLRPSPPFPVAAFPFAHSGGGPRAPGSPPSPFPGAAFAQRPRRAGSVR